MEIKNHGNRLSVNDAGRIFEILSDPAALSEIETSLRTTGIGTLPIPSGDGSFYNNNQRNVANTTEGRDKHAMTTNNNPGNSYLPLPEPACAENTRTACNVPADGYLPLPPSLTDILANERQEKCGCNAECDKAQDYLPLPKMTW